MDEINMELLLIRNALNSVVCDIHNEHGVRHIEFNTIGGLDYECCCDDMKDKIHAAIVQKNLLRIR